MPETKKMVLMRWLCVRASCCRHNPWDKINGMAMMPPNAVKQCCKGDGNMENAKPLLEMDCRVNCGVCGVAFTHLPIPVYLAETNDGRLLLKQVESVRRLTWMPRKMQRYHGGTSVTQYASLLTSPSKDVSMSSTSFVSDRSQKCPSSSNREMTIRTQTVWFS